MKKEFPVFLLLLALIGWCLHLESSKILQPETTKIKAVDSLTFEQISISVPGKIVFTSNIKNKVMIEGPSDLIDDISWQISHNTLQINSSRYYYAENWKRLFFNRAAAFTIYIAVAEPEQWRVTGTGSLLGKIHRSENQLSIESLGLGEVFVYQAKDIQKSSHSTNLLSLITF